MFNTVLLYKTITYSIGQYLHSSSSPSICCFWYNSQFPVFLPFFPLLPMRRHGVSLYGHGSQGIVSPQQQNSALVKNTDEASFEEVRAHAEFLDKSLGGGGGSKAMLKRNMYLAGGYSDLRTSLQIPVAVNNNKNINDGGGGGKNSAKDIRRLRRGYKEKWLGSDLTVPAVMGRQRGQDVPPQGCVSQQDGGGVVMDLLEVVMCEAEAS